MESQSQAFLVPVASILVYLAEELLVAGLELVNMEQEPTPSLLVARQIVVVVT